MKKNKIKISNLYMALYAFFSGLTIDFVGRLVMAELIALFVVPFKLKSLFQTYPVLKKITFIYLLLLLSLMFSDIINSISSLDYLRGWACIIFSYISFCFLLSQINNKSVVFFLLFYALSVSLFGEEEIDLIYMNESSNYFKSRIAPLLSQIVLLLAYLLYKANRNIPVFIFLGYGLLSIILGARSGSLPFFLGALLLFVKMKNIKLSGIRIFSVGIFVSIIFYAGYCVYVSQVLDGSITSGNSQQVQSVKNPYNPFELLTEGRKETFVAYDAILKKPLLGYGSWAKIENYQSILPLYVILFREEGIIPAHSVILGAWLWAGIIGFISIILLYWVLLKLFWKSYKNRNTNIRISILLVPMAISMVWNALFSPFGHLRQTLPIHAAFIIYAYYQSNISYNKKQFNNQ
jgi:O-antigen ligase